MNHTALLIIDMQVGATRLTDTPIYQMRELIRTLQLLIARARQQHGRLVYIQHHTPGGYPASGSDDWQLIPEIAPATADLIIHKTTPDSFHQTSLHEHLQQEGIRRLVIAGIQTPYCIDTTCRRARSLGYEVILVRDGHSTFDSPVLPAGQIIAHHNQIIGDWFGTVVESADIAF
jgi:nicotinamidase-related amidase